MNDVLVTGDLQVNGTQTFSLAFRVAMLYDKKTSGTAAGGSASAAMQDRTLNTVDDPDDLITLDGGNVLFSFNKLGTYLIQGKAPAYRTGTSKMFITNSSNTVMLIGSSSQTANSTVFDQCDSYISGILTVTSTTTQYKVRQYTLTAIATNGLGNAVSTGNNELYTYLRIIKIT